MNDPTPPAPTRGEPRLVRSVAAAAGVIAAITVVARLAGFARTLVFADAVKAGPVGTAYQTVNTVPNVVFEVAAGGILAAVAIPLIAGHLGRRDVVRADRVADALLTWILTLLVPLAGLVALGAGPISRWLLRGHGTDSVAMGERMLLVFAPQIVLYGIGIVLTGLLQAHRRFVASALAPLFSSLVVIATYLAYGRLAGRALRPADAAIDVLAWGTTLGVVALSLPLFLPAWRMGWRPRLTWSFPVGDAARVVRLAAAGLLGLVGQQACVVATLWLTNHRGGEGAVNIYQYSQAVYVLPYAVLAVPIAVAAFPALAGAAEAAASITTLRRSLVTIVVITVGAAAVLIAVAGPIGAFFTGLDAHGVDAANEALSALPVTLTAYAPGVVGFAVTALLTRALYVRGRPVTAGIVVAAGWGLAALIPLGLLLGAAPALESTLTTLGVASSIGMTATAVALTVLVTRHWGGAVTSGLARTVGAAVVGGVVAAVLGRVVADRWVVDGLAGAVLVGVVVGGVVTLGYAAWLSVADRDTMRILTRRGTGP